MFPLRLTAFEEYFLVNDHAQAPSSFLFRFQLSGPFDLRAFRQALDVTTNLHPLSQCKIVLDHRNRPWWRPTDFEIPIERLDSIVGQYPNLPPLNVFSGRTLVAWVDEDLESQNFTLVLQIHHCVFDGTGCLQFFTDWLNAYEGFLDQPAKSSVERTPQRKYDPLRLRKRCRSGATLVERIKLLPGQWRSIKATYQIMSRSVIRLVPKADVAEASQGRDAGVRCGVRSYVFDQRSTERLTLAAKKSHSTVNNLLATSLFLAVNRWQQDTGIRGVGSHLRVTIPINERNAAEHDRLSGCNHCTIISLDRSREDLGRPTDLHQGIRRDMETIQRSRLSQNFWRALMVMRWLPGGLEKRMKASNQTATTYISNLGNVSKHIDRNRLPERDRRVNVVDMDVAATLQHQMGAAFVAMFFEGRLKLAMHFHRDIMGDQQAEGLLKSFRAQVMQHAQIEFATSPLPACARPVERSS
ncbi:MAG: wax ester/triacylglycerol synthase domain-containing protein [Planctomycetota bacterium]